MTNPTKLLSKLLKWSWVEPFDFTAALKKAVDENDAAGIQIGREKLETELRKLHPSPASDSDKAEKVEIEAKIAVVVAIQSNKSEDWTTASVKFKELAQFFYLCMGKCRPGQDNYWISFKRDHETAKHFAVACTAKAQGLKEVLIHSGWYVDDPDEIKI